MPYKISYTNGERADSFDTLEEAKSAILARWPDAKIGHDGDLEGFGDRTLFWENEEASTEDDGAFALGSIRREP